MPVSKKSHKKYNKNKVNHNKEIARHWISHLFTPLFQFFYKLKKGEAEVITADNKEYVSLNIFGKQHLAHEVLEKWCLFMYLILRHRKIHLEFAPLLSFKNFLLERGTEKLYFDMFEIQKALTFLYKVQNIFQKEITVQDVQKGRYLLSTLFDGHEQRVKEYNLVE